MRTTLICCMLHSLQKASGAGGFPLKMANPVSGKLVLALGWEPSCDSGVPVTPTLVGHQEQATQKYQVEVLHIL